jgi:type I restriction enzyme S subunit
MALMPLRNSGGSLSQFIAVSMADGTFTIETPNYFNDRFIYFFLKCQEAYLKSQKREGGVPTIDRETVEKIKIPIPPLPIQQEIVKILDTFTTLEAELEARKKQYEYYRDELLTFEGNVEWKELQQLAEFSQGIQVDISKQILEKQDNFVRFLRIVDFVKDDELPRYIKNPGDRYIKNEGDLVMIRYGASAAGKVFLKYSGAIANNMFQIKLTTKEITIRYLHCYLSQTKIYNFLNSNGGSSTMPAITFGQIGAVKIPIPPLAEQHRIVAILDKFDVLVNDISIGLPAELNARRKQYEYYRDKLLSFKPLEKEYAS